MPNFKEDLKIRVRNKIFASGIAQADLALAEAMQSPINDHFIATRPDEKNVYIKFWSNVSVTLCGMRLVDMRAQIAAEEAVEISDTTSITPIEAIAYLFPERFNLVPQSFDIMLSLPVASTGAWNKIVKPQLAGGATCLLLK